MIRILKLTAVTLIGLALASVSNTFCAETPAGLGLPAQNNPLPSSACMPGDPPPCPGSEQLTAPQKLLPSGPSPSFAPASLGYTLPAVRPNSPKASLALPASQPSVSDSAAAPHQPGLKPIEPATQELSAIERAMLEASKGSAKTAPHETSAKPLRQFGYSYFRPDSPGFSALTDIPVGPDYILGAGDRIALTLWGSVEGTYELEVNRSGEIILPKVGTIKVAGVPFGQLPKLLNGQILKVFRDFQLSVTMGRLRMIKVYVVGEITAPGDYTISSLSTLLNALSAAGGPTRNGSLRSVSVKRDGRIVETVDLYDFFLKGDKSRDIRLQPGDTIFVPSIGPVVGLGGNVRRPAIYELKTEKSLKDVLALADGIMPTGYLQRLQMFRVEAHDRKTVVDINLAPQTTGKPLDDITAGVAVQDMDLLRILPIDGRLRGYARLEGHVRRPGDYALKPGMRLSALLPPDNILPETNMNVGEIVRLYPPDLHPEKLQFRPGQAIKGDTTEDRELQEFDQVRIFSRWELEEMPTVRISGEVQKPGEYRLMNNMRVLDLLTGAGYPKRTAYLKDAEINRIQKTAATVTSAPIVINLEEAMKGSPAHNILLEPFDELLVRRIPNWSEETERHITLKGEFRFPGTYPIYKGERLSSVIRRAGGFTDRAYLKAAKFTRTPVRELQQKRIDEFIAQSEQELARRTTELASTASTKEELESARAVMEGVKGNLHYLKAAKAEGRVVIQLNQLDAFAGSPYDFEAIAGDTLEIPQRTNTVSVLGRVVNPTNFAALDGRTVADYLESAGGTTADSETSEIYVVRVDGSVFSRQQYSSLTALLGGGFMGEELESGDTIVVPQRFERTPWMRTVKDITTIMSQLAITAGTVLLGLR